MTKIDNQVTAEMQAATEQPLFSVTVPYNHPVLAKTRKTAHITTGILCIVGALLVGAVALGALLSDDSGNMTILAIIMAAIGVFMLGGAVYNFMHLKPSDRDNSKDVQLQFMAEGMHVVRNDQVTGKNKSLENCLYRPYANKQYVAKIYDYENRLEIKIRTGSYNGAPQYSLQVMPKDVLDAAQASALLSFLQEKLGKHYVRK